MQTEIARLETFERVQKIAKSLRGTDGVAEFDEGLFTMLDKSIRE